MDGEQTGKRMAGTRRRKSQRKTPPTEAERGYDYSMLARSHRCLRA
jgi:hypothetical protein